MRHTSRQALIVPCSCALVVVLMIAVVVVWVVRGWLRVSCVAVVIWWGGKGVSTAMGCFGVDVEMAYRCVGVLEWFVAWD